MIEAEDDDIEVTAGEEGEITIIARDEYDNEIEGETIEVDDTYLDDNNDEEIDELEEHDSVDTDDQGKAVFSFRENTSGDYTAEFSAEDDEDIDTEVDITVDPSADLESLSMEVSEPENNGDIEEDFDVEEENFSGIVSEEVEAVEITAEVIDKNAEVIEIADNELDNDDITEENDSEYIADVALGDRGTTTSFDIVVSNENDDDIEETYEIEVEREGEDG